MKVYGECSTCKTEISYSTYTTTRVEFAMREGEEIILECKSCNSKTKFHVDELYTKKSKIAQTVAIWIFIVGTPLMALLINPTALLRANTQFLVVGGFLLVPVSVYMLLLNQDQTRVNSFNRSRLKGRIHNFKK